jgi:alkylation response protein AidB-like acyl-CoA dehydrogenase
MDLAAERPWWPLGDLDQMGEAMRFWIARNWAADITVREWWHRLAEAGLTAPTWPRAQGGIAATSIVQQVIERELAIAGTIAPPVDHLGFRVVAPALRQFATSVQLSRWMPDLLCGVSAWTPLVYEPGIDDPRDGAAMGKLDWKYITVSGRKSRLDTEAPTHALLLVRTGTGDTTRVGLTCVGVDLSSPTVTVEDELITFDHTEVGRDDIVGNVEAGWAVWRAAEPYLDRSLAGRIRRGLIPVAAGTAAGQLDRTVGDITASYTPPAPPAHDRRGR